MNKILFTIYFGIYVTCNISAQKINRSYIFGNSLVHHEFQVNPTPSQEASVPHWLHLLSEAANHQYEVSGQYGFLPQHAQLPPISNWSFDLVQNPWDSDYETFGEVDFTNIIITPGNFIQWQAPDVNYPAEQLSPVSATADIINWAISQEEMIDIYIYEGWPDMSGYLNNDFPPTPEEYSNYNQYLNGDYHTWFRNYLDLLQQDTESNCLKIIPVSSLLSTLLLQAPYNQIPITELYEDDAPHGRPTLYFLAALITYMTTYEEMAPTNYQFDPIIHPIISDNYQDVIQIFWNELNSLNSSAGISEVFCNEITSIENDPKSFSEKGDIFPNPFYDQIIVEAPGDLSNLKLQNINGDIIFDTSINDNMSLHLPSIPEGIYIALGKNKSGQTIFRKKIIKL